METNKDNSHQSFYVLMSIQNSVNVFSWLYSVAFLSQKMSGLSVCHYTHFVPLYKLPEVSIFFLLISCISPRVSPAGPAGSGGAAAGCSVPARRGAGGSACPTGTSAASSGCGCTGASALPTLPLKSAAGPLAAPHPASAP